MIRAIQTSNAPAPIGPYNQAIIAGDMLFVSGQIALDPLTGELKSGNIQDETRQVMANLEAILNESGCKFDQVVKCSIFVRDMNDFGLVNEIYGQYFPNTPPARETVEVSGLPKGVKVEISCIAYLR